MIQSRTHITVRYSETDGMGIVYHGSYLPWFEVGRTTMLKEQGIVYRELEASGFFLPVLDLSIKFHRPARYDDTLTIVSAMREKPTLRIRIEYEIFNAETLLVTGHTRHAFIDKQGRPVRPPAIFAERMNALFA